MKPNTCAPSTPTTVRLSGEDRQRLEAIRRAAGLGPLAPSQSQVLRVALALGMEQLESMLAGNGSVRRAAVARMLESLPTVQS